MKKIKKQIRFSFMALLPCLIYSSCNSDAQNSDSYDPKPFVFAKGADVSWLPQMDATGYKFYNTDGLQTDCLQLLKDRGINTIRLRVFVNPSNHTINGHCSPAETVAMAVRAKNMGMRIMIDFHYSDTWADPAHQAKPASWVSHSFVELKNDVYNHTFDVLTALKTAGVTPEWVQIGNEIPSGMLWPEGHTDNWSQLVQLLNKGYEATKALDSSIKVIIHIDKGNDNARFRWFFDNLTSNSAKFDVIGMSYYPYWLNTDYTSTIGALQNNLKDMASRYAKEVMVVEVGGDYTKIQNTYDMLLAVNAAVKNVPNNKGLGVIYWEPQGEKSWSGYQLNAWQSNGKPSGALNAFSDTLDPPVILTVEQVKVDGFVTNPVQQTANVTVNLTYTADTATRFFYVGLTKRNSSGMWLQTIAQSSGNQFLVPSVGTNINSQVTLTVPSSTLPSVSLSNGEYYDIEIQLWTENWGTKLSTSQSSKLTVTPSSSLGIDDTNFIDKWIIYPNPVVDILNFKSVDILHSIQSLKITNVLGKIVYFENNAANINSIDVSKFSSGLYIVSVNSIKETQQFKFYKK